MQEALTALRRLRPDDRLIQVDTVRSYAAGMQTAHARLDYYRTLVGKEAVPADVRSVIAMDAAATMMEMKRPEEAARMVESALQLNPLNGSALMLKYSLMPASAAPADRAAVLVQMLRANPGNAVAAAELADLVARAGLARESLDWYSLAGSLIQATSGAPSRDMLLTLAAQQLVAGELKGGRGLIDAVLAVDRFDYAFLMLRALVLRASGEDAEAQKAIDQTRNALVNELATARKALGVRSATTHPIDRAPLSLPDDLSGDVELYRKTPDEGLRRMYASAL
jgi:hypothetical protein